MNKVVTSKEAILEQCRRIVMEKGLSAVNMRTVANACGVAVGSIYNYFPSKSDLIIASVEDVWRDIFHMTEESLEFGSFTECLSWLFVSIQMGCRKYPGFFTLHSMNFASEEKEEGRQMMRAYFEHMKNHLRHVLDKDPNVRPDAFSKTFSQNIFIDMMFSLLTSLLLQEDSDCAPMLEVAARCIY